MSKKFKHLNLSPHWQQYFSKYPDGYTIIENLIDWVSQVDDMVDNQNKMNDTVNTFGDRLDEFIGQYDTHLQETLEQTLSDWQDSGFLNIVINEALDTKYHEMDERLTTQLAQKIGKNTTELAINMFNENDRSVLQGLNEGQINAVLGVRNVEKKNIRTNSVTPAITTFIKPSLNHFNRNHPDNKANHLFISGVPAPFSGYFVSHKIEVTPGETWTITRAEPQAVFFFDEETAKPISSTGSKNGGVEEPFTFEVPQGVAFMVLQNLNAVRNNFMAVKSDTLPAEFEPYKLTLDGSINLSEEHKLSVANNNPLHGKTISWNGDSIMSGDHASEGGFAEVISVRNSMVSENRAVGGGTLAKDTSQSHWICEDIQNMRSDADYVIFNGGVNDASLQVPLGVMTTDYTSELDETTYAGALESICKQIITRYSSSKVGFVQVHRMLYRQSQYIEMTFNILKKWGIPYIDLYHNTPPIGHIEQLKNVYTYSNDGWHPNNLGYEVFYNDKIESWLKTL